jgi:hypothetical protein
VEEGAKVVAVSRPGLKSMSVKSRLSCLADSCGRKGNTSNGGVGVDVNRADKIVKMSER